jgi:polyisoprenoid-binding protein YceI
VTTFDMHRSDAVRGSRSWQLDPGRSRVEFHVPHFWGLARVVGHFDRFAGTLAVGDDGSRDIRLEIEAASLDTGNARRDRHLRSADFFAAESHPLIRFESSLVSGESPGPLLVEGTLEAAGRAIALLVDVELHEDGQELELRGSARVDQRRLGMTWSPLGMVRGSALVHVTARMRPR